MRALLRTTRRRGVPQTVLVGACGTVEARPGIAMNLALCAAGSGDRVLLIDAALSERQLSQTLAASAVIGLGEIAGGIITPGLVGPSVFGGISNRSMTGVRRPLRNTISNAGSTLGLANRYQAAADAPW